VGAELVRVVKGDFERATAGHHAPDDTDVIGLLIIGWKRAARDAIGVRIENCVLGHDASSQGPAFIDCCATLLKNRGAKAHTMEPVTGCVHLAVEAGCGGTTFALQQARTVLADGRHVVWVCAEMPDGQRFSQLYEDVSPVAVARLHMAAVGDNIGHGITSALGLLGALNSIGLVIVDDWTAKTGKAPAELLTSIRSLIDCCQEGEVPLLLISSAYEDASGKGWKSRGGLKVETWFLHPEEMSIRNIVKSDSTQQCTLGDEGFTPRT